MKAQKPVKQKKCKVCTDYFTPRDTFQRACSPKCALEIAKSEGEKLRALEARTQRKRDREKREELKTLRELLNEAQKAFNAYIRERDRDLPCISCGRWHEGQWHAGHFKTVGANSNLRFDEDNVHKQCSACNNHKSGNIVEYRFNLVKKIGIPRVEALENAPRMKRYTKEQAREIKAKYKQKLKELKDDNEKDG